MSSELLFDHVRRLVADPHGHICMGEPALGGELPSHGGVITPPDDAEAQVAERSRTDIGVDESSRRQRNAWRSAGKGR